MLGSPLVRLAAFALSLAGSVATGAEPRYAFRVGEELVYEKTAAVDRLAAPASYAANQPLDQLFRTVVTPVRQNADGTWRLLIRTTVRLFRFREEGPPGVRFENETLGYVDLAPDGVYVRNPTLGETILFNLVPEVLFPPLPRSEGPSRPTEATGATYALGKLPTRYDMIWLGGPVTTPLDARYNNHVSLLVKFDPAAGRPTVLRRDSAGGDPGDWFNTATTIELVAVRQRSPEWVATYGVAADRYLEVRADHSRAWEEAVNDDDPVICQRRLDDLLGRVEAARAAEGAPGMASLYDSLVALHQRESVWAVGEAAKRRAVYDLPPLDWEAVDLDDEPSFTRVGLAGKVVLLDFWYRGCSHCIKALPALKRVRQRFADRPVVVLGVNKDRDPQDARHVIEAFGVPYPTVRDVLPQPVGEHDRVSDAYGVTGWPTFVVLRRDGRVGAVLVGNNDRLESNLTAAIERALDAAP